MSVNGELAAAARRVSALREQIPARHRPAFDVPAWNKLNRRVAKADPDRALELIAAWEFDAKLALSGALVNSPLDREAS